MPAATMITPLGLAAVGLGGFLLGSLAVVAVARMRPRMLGLADRRAVAERLDDLRGELAAELRALTQQEHRTMSRPRPAPPIRMVPRVEGGARQEAA